MIDEELTWRFYGYHSDDLSYGSGKQIVARCDECCQYRVLPMVGYHDICWRCGQRSKKIPLRTPEWIHNMSESKKGILNPLFGKPRSNATKKLISDSQIGEKNHMHKRNECSFFARRKLSATQQGIPVEEWTGFVANDAYCEKFDEDCRERIRAKYGHRCFICGKPQDENITKTGKHKKLSVHHADMNKNQGCDGIQWKLVPLCMTCHGKSHSDPMKSRIKYTVKME